VSGITIIYNLPTSSTDLEFWTREGSLAFTPLYLPPGDTVVIGSTGAIEGDYVIQRNQHINKVNKTGKPLVITITGPATFIDPQTGQRRWLGPGQPYTGTWAPGQQINIDFDPAKGGMVKGITDAIITFTSGHVLALFMPSSFPEPDDWNLELLSGSVQSADNTSSFTSIEDKYVATGCIPEPTTLWLFGSGVLGVFALLRSKSKL
jgi:hypothetical protein